MEDTLRVRIRFRNYQRVQRLNPCFNGRYSQSLCTRDNRRLETSLNPCFNGRYSQRQERYGS